MKCSNLLVWVILLFINEHYRKTNKGEKEKQKTKTEKKREREIKLIAPTIPPFYFE